MRKFVINIPSEIAFALSRRHSGNKLLGKEDIAEAIAKMNMLWAHWEEINEKLNYCGGEWWDRMQIERHFMQRRWYYAHAKYKKLRIELKETHKAMFYLMVVTDGNYEPFNDDAMYARDIVDDFNRKYTKLLVEKMALN